MARYTKRWRDVVDIECKSHRLRELRFERPGQPSSSPASPFHLGLKNLRARALGFALFVSKNGRQHDWFNWLTHYINFIIEQTHFGPARIAFNHICSLPAPDRLLPPLLLLSELSVFDMSSIAMRRFPSAPSVRLLPGLGNIRQYLLTRICSFQRH